MRISRLNYSCTKRISSERKNSLVSCKGECSTVEVCLSRTPSRYSVLRPTIYSLKRIFYSDTLNSNFDRT